MLYDSINYIKEKEAILMLGIEIARVLKPGGVFVFDIVTREGLMAHMDDYYETNTWEGLAYQRDSWFESNESIQYNTFSFLFNGERYKEIHEQKIRPSDEWKQLLSGSLTVEATYADFSFKPASDSNIRIHFLCSKK